MGASPVNHDATVEATGLLRSIDYEVAHDICDQDDENQNKGCAPRHIDHVVVGHAGKVVNQYSHARGGFRDTADPVAGEERGKDNGGRLTCRTGYGQHNACDDCRSRSRKRRAQYGLRACST